MRQKAFSLVELSIVLVILGLLVGGILAGRSLIRASELRAVTTEYQRHKTSLHAFRDKYFALPGDMPNATAFWGTASACPGDADDARTTTATCNGDGDGQIRENASSSNERFGAWHHLANAGLVEGNFTGVSGSSISPASQWAIVGTNVPASKLANAGWTLGYKGNINVNDTNWIDGAYSNFLLIGGQASAGNSAAARIFLPEEAWNIDKKIDDSEPGRGKFVVLESQTECYLLSNGNSGSISGLYTRQDIQYDLTQTEKACVGIFRNIF